MAQSSSCRRLQSPAGRGPRRFYILFAGGADGDDPDSDLVFEYGKLYGTTRTGGGGTDPNCYVSGDGCGTIFAVKP